MFCALCGNRSVASLSVPVVWDSGTELRVPENVEITYL
ncbi:hypothetical protein NIES2104_21970 [Leptolyngbya sp. NIES-2104]|nr:hypothetical protein NIES2104_21970 [Leptolyngbya sp. NIES-2104]